MSDALLFSRKHKNKLESKKLSRLHLKTWPNLRNTNAIIDQLSGEQDWFILKINLMNILTI